MKAFIGTLIALLGIRALLRAGDLWQGNYPHTPTYVARDDVVALLLCAGLITWGIVAVLR
jgi:hypothetical protein